MAVAPSIHLPATPYSGAAPSGVQDGLEPATAPATSQAGMAALLDQTGAVPAGQAAPAATDQVAQVASANRNGAPAIAAALKNFSSDEVALLLQGMKMKNDEGRLRAAKEGLGVTRQNLAVEHKKSMDKLQESIKKAESAAAKSKVSKIFGWIAKVAAVIGSLVSVVALVATTGLTGGAAGPLLALALVGLVASTMSLASAISQSQGGPTLDLNTAMNWACKSLLEAVGVPKDKIEAASHTMAGALGLVTGAWMVDAQLVGSLASGAAALGNASENQAAIIGATFAAVAGIAVAVVTAVASGGVGATEAVKKAVEKIPQAVNVVQYSLAGAGAANSLVNAGMNIDVAFDEHGAAMAQVDRQKFAAVIAKLQALMEQDSELISKVVHEIEEALSQIAQMIAAAGESHMQIASNIGHPMA